MGDNNAPWNSDSVRSRQWRYDGAGTYSVKCTVSDGTGHSAMVTKSLTVNGPTVHTQNVVAADGANQCDNHLCAFIQSDKYNYARIYVNGPAAKEGWFGSMNWMTGFQAAAFAFDAVSIPKDTNVEVAYLMLDSDSGSLTQNIGSVDIKVELSVASKGLVEDMSGSNWNCGKCLTTQRTWTQPVAWVVPDWAGGATARSQDFAPLIRELVALSGWTGTGRVVVSLTPRSGSGVIAVLKANTRLVVKWQTAAPGGSCPSINLTSMEATGTTGSSTCYSDVTAATPTTAAPTTTVAGGGGGGGATTASGSDSSSSGGGSSSGASGPGGGDSATSGGKAGTASRAASRPRLMGA